MKKIMMISLLASFAISTHVSALSLSEALKASKVKGEVKFQYFNISPVADSKNDTITAIGGNINLITGSFKGFKAGLTFQTSSIFNKNIEGTNDFTATMDASGAVMSEAYLEYEINNTNLKVGRQYISTPLLAGSSSRMIKESFESYSLSNTDLPATKILATYVTKFQSRTNNTGEPGTFIKSNDGAYSIYANNSSIKDLILQAQYLDVKGLISSSDKNALYLDASYTLSGVNLAIQHMSSSNGNIDGSLLGFRASSNIAMFNVTALYTTTGSKGTIYSGLGSGADGAFTALPVHGGAVTYTKDTDTAVIVLATNIKGVTAVAYYGQVKTDAATSPLLYKRINAMGGFLQYSFTKDLNVKLMYESADFDSQNENDDILRLYTSYSF